MSNLRVANQQVFGIPIAELRRLDFLIGESSGVVTLYPPEMDPIQFQGYFSVSREACERFLRIEFYGDIPNVGIESIHALLTYCSKIGAYRMWSFATSQEESLVMTGNFEGDSLVMVSEPADMIWGLQKLRTRFTPREDGIFTCYSELWTIDGYVPYSEAAYRQQSAIVP
jgi:hypothetical protein